MCISLHILYEVYQHLELYKICGSLLIILARALFIHIDYSQQLINCFIVRKTIGMLSELIQKISLCSKTYHK